MMKNKIYEYVRLEPQPLDKYYAYCANTDLLVLLVRELQKMGIDELDELEKNSEIKAYLDEMLDVEKNTYMEKAKIELGTLSMDVILMGCYQLTRAGQEIMRSVGIQPGFLAIGRGSMSADWVDENDSQGSENDSQGSENDSQGSENDSQGSENDSIYEYIKKEPENITGQHCISAGMLKEIIQKLTENNKIEETTPVKVKLGIKTDIKEKSIPQNIHNLKRRLFVRLNPKYQLTHKGIKLIEKLGYKAEELKMEE